jgi:hypothetical protein
MCGIVANRGPNGESLACAYLIDHDGPHSWSTLPTWTPDVLEKFADQLRRKYNCYRSLWV